MQKLIIIICILFSSTCLYSWDRVFLQTARVAGTGGAVVAGSDDLSAFMINPAGLGTLNSIQLTGDLFDLYGAGFKNTFAGIFYPFFNGGGTAFVWQRINYEGALEFENKEDIYCLVFSRQIFGIKIGITGKYLNEYLKSNRVKFTKSDYDMDMGIIKNFNGFGIGLSILNIQPFFKKNINRYTIVNAGLFVNILKELKLLFDYRNIEKESEISIGAEYTPLDDIVLRTGWYMDFYYSLGLSYFIRRFRVDYAFSVSQYNIGMTHYFSINYFFNQ